MWTGQKPQPVQSFAVSVLTPTPTPVPSPAITQFDVSPTNLTAGDSITVTYNLTGYDNAVLRIPGLLPADLKLDFPSGRQVFPVATPGEFTVILDAVKLPTGSTDAADLNRATVRGVRTIAAIPPTPTPSPTVTPTPTPLPQVPSIEVFDLSPKKEIVRGEAITETLTWNVLGDAERIDISAPEFSLSTTKKQDTVGVPTDKTRLFVITAFLNEKPAASKSVELKVVEPTPTPPPPPTVPPPPPTDTPTPTATPIPIPLVEKFEATADPPLTIARTVDDQGVDVYCGRRRCAGKDQLEGIQRYFGRARR